MPGPFFTSNPSDFLQLPGLYVQEINPPGFIQGVGRNTLGVVGQTLRGPVDTPVEIGSPARFTEVFGDRSRFGSTTEVNFVRQFIMNKRWSTYVVVRAAAAAAVSASRDFNQTATPVLDVTASSPGAWAGDLTIDIVNATDAVSTHFDLIVNYRGTTTRYQNLSITGSEDNLVAVVGTDLGRLVTLTKIASGRPDNIAAAALTSPAGADGTIADTDYTATGRAIDKIKAYPGVAFFTSADRMTAAVKSSLTTAAAASPDRIALLWNGNHSETVANVATDAALYRSDRVIYCENSPYTFDQDIAAEVQVPPHAAMATILAMTDVNVDPIDQDNKQFLAWITRLQSESRTRSDFITLKNAGVCALEKFEGFGFSEGVVNFLTSGRTRITRRRSADYLILSAANRLKYFPGKENTVAQRIAIASELISFSTDLRDVQKRIIEEFAVDGNSQNTANSRAQGLEVILWQVKLIGHMLSLVLKAQIGETVTITEAT